MDRYVKRGTTSVILRIPLNVAPGNGSYAPGTDPNLIINVWVSGETSPIGYSAVNFDDTIETITTLGTYQAPSTYKARARGINSSSYLEVHLADEIFAKPGAELSIMVTDTSLIVASYTVGLTNLDIHNGEVSPTSAVKKNTANADGFPVVMRDSTTHLPVAGKTVTAARSIDGGAFGAGTLGAMSEVSAGVYKMSGWAAADVNGSHIMLKFSAAGCDDTLVHLVTAP